MKKVKMLGLPLTINGLKGEWVQVNLKYNYKKNATKCPFCHGLGNPWGGWFHCMDRGYEECGVALVEDGRCFMRLDAYMNREKNLAVCKGLS